jgi:hypothetical protein
VLGITVNEVQRSILGEAPNDFESSRDLCYLPVREGWFYGDVTGQPPYPTPLGPTGDASKDLDYRIFSPPSRRVYGPFSSTPYNPYNQLGSASLGDAVEELNKLNKRLFWLQAFSTVSIVTLASLAVIKAVRDHKNGKSLLGDNVPHMRMLGGGVAAVDDMDWGVNALCKKGLRRQKANRADQG